VIRTAAGAHGYVKLSDGSLVEMNERSAFDVKARGKDMTVDLDRGAVMVQAAKRKAGHLYVKTPDCRVAVTGTVFGVKAGVKGSRVSVVEGTVKVAYNGLDDTLQSGDQVSTGANMEAVPVSDDISWSHDLDKHLALLAEFHKLGNRLQQVQLPAPRYDSKLLARMPADTLFYASLPNAGQALEDANRILQEQIQQSDTLREFWTHGQPGKNDEWNDMIAKLRELSDYLGDEVVIVGFGDQQPGAVVAEVRRTGLKDFLNTRFADVHGQKLTVVEPGDLASLPAKSNGPLALVRQNEVVFSGEPASLIKINAQLDAGASGLDGTQFGQRLAEAYHRGAGFFFAADLQRLIQSSRHPRDPRHQAELVRSGISDMRYLVVEHRELNNVPENRMTLDFGAQRRGIPSWLAAPAPMGSLDFVSRNASIAVAFVAKDPQQMLTDVFNMAADQSKAQAKLADINAKLNLDIQRDLAAHFGGDAVLALDGPVLPTPSWKFVIEVHDADGLAASLETLVQSCNAEAQRNGHPGVTLVTEDVNGQKYYTVQAQSSGAKPMYYTFSNGYMIVGPDRATLMNTLQTRTTGDSLGRSGDFKALLPKDDNANYSMIAYQNLAPILQPLLSTVNSDQAKVIEDLAADSRPSVICGWGRDSRIEAISNSRLLGYDWLAVVSLLGRGTRNQ
jgi:FecR protein